jgi:hypothetical protein
MAAGKQLDAGWKVEYTEIKRADGIDMDPHYIAPEVALLFCPFALLLVQGESKTNG